VCVFVAGGRHLHIIVLSGLFRNNQWQSQWRWWNCETCKTPVKSTPSETYQHHSGPFTRLLICSFVSQHCVKCPCNFLWSVTITFTFAITTTIVMKKCSETNTARPPQSTHRCTESAMAVARQSQNFPPMQTPFLRALDRQNLISWRWWPPTPTDPVWWRSMRTISSYRGNRHRPPATNTHTDSTDYNTLCRWLVRSVITRSRQFPKLFVRTLFSMPDMKMLHN